MTGNQLFDRAIVLFETNRYADAEKLLMQGLAQHPEDPLGLGLLALCRIRLDKDAEALEAARQAVALAPENLFVLTTYGRTLFVNNQNQEARRSLMAALAIDPTYADAYSVLAQIEYQESRWELALNNAESGLEHDPADQTLINLRAMALVKLKRSEEAAQTMDYALYNDPEDAFSHGNKGWVQIERNQFDDAVASFREALRLDPNNEYARQGLKEAIKGKNWLYRGILWYFLFMGKLSSANQWLVIIGLYFGVRILRSVANYNEALRPFIAPLLIAYMLFAFATWIGQPLSNLFLRLHPIGKLALNDDEKRFSSLTGIFLLLGLLTLGLGYWGLSDKTLGGNVIILGTTLLVMLIPVGGVSGSVEGSKNRRWLTLYALVLFALGPVCQLLSLPGGAPLFGGMPLAVFGLGVVLYGWVANALR
jgi:Tfp pilus assembly protein PilF